MDCKKTGLLAGLCLLIGLTCVYLPAQSAFLDHNQEGKGMDLCLMMRGLRFKDIGLGVGYSLNGLIDLGLNLSVAAAEVDDRRAAELKAAVVFAIPVIKQERTLPLSLLLNGSFGRSAIMSGELEEQGLVKTSLGYSVGADIYHTLVLSPQWALRLGASGRYESFTYTTEQAGGAAGGGYPQIVSVSNFYAGLLFGASYRPSRQLVISADLNLYLDRDLTLVYGPTLSITLPKDIS